MFRAWSWMIDNFGMAASVCLGVLLAMVFAPSLWGWSPVASGIGLAVTFFGLLIYIAIRSAWLQMQPPRRSAIRKRRQKRLRAPLR
ncbi:MAG: hypothetical protein GYB36_02665 [Alphaproteobacteria bacterium]|nr:hypothetical protein [Alphaproteobacteria bacterium]